VGGFGDGGGRQGVVAAGGGQVEEPAGAMRMGDSPSTDAPDAAAIVGKHGGAYEIFESS
jgi:hypothetical protein